MRRRTLLAAGTLAGVGAGLYGLVVRGALTLDLGLGLGRTLQPLGPLVVSIEAPRDVVFNVISRPYLGRTPRALARKLQVLERGDDLVLAAHFTQVGPVVTTTVETVRFEPPAAVHFRLVRGPVPHVVEQFDLSEHDGVTELAYQGELGTDLWALGSLWGRLVATKWTETVRDSLAGIKAEAERRARPQRRG